MRSRRPRIDVWCVHSFFVDHHPGSLRAKPGSGQHRRVELLPCSPSPVRRVELAQAWSSVWWIEWGTKECSPPGPSRSPHWVALSKHRPRTVYRYRNTSAMDHRAWRLACVHWCTVRTEPLQHDAKGPSSSARYDASGNRSLLRQRSVASPMMCQPRRGQSPSSSGWPTVYSVCTLPVRGPCVWLGRSSPASHRSSASSNGRIHGSHRKRLARVRIARDRSRALLETHCSCCLRR